MELIFVKPESAEWNDMWDKLSLHPLNEDYPEPSTVLNQGEQWQYMGSFKLDNRILHEFHHRMHPRFERREDVKFPASELLVPEDIQKSVQIK